jgi:hypothetical protein
MHERNAMGGIGGASRRRGKLNFALGCELFDPSFSARYNRFVERE